MSGRKVLTISAYRGNLAVMKAQTDQKIRPEFVTREHLEYLDELRESGETNMFGAAPFLVAQFPELADGKASFHSPQKARDILSYWMQSFGNPDR